VNIKDLAQSCAKAINDSHATPFITPRISLKMPEDKKCPKQRHLFGAKSPVGVVTEFGFDGYDTVIFDAIDVLAYLNAIGAVTLVGAS
jgi:hypothetical protein